MDIIDTSSKTGKGVLLLGVVRLSDRAVLACQTTGDYTGAALKEVCVGVLL